LHKDIPACTYTIIEALHPHVWLLATV